MSEAVYTSGSALYIKARGRDQSAAATIVVEDHESPRGRKRWMWNKVYVTDICNQTTIYYQNMKLIYSTGSLLEHNFVLLKSSRRVLSTL